MAANKGACGMSAKVVMKAKVDGFKVLWKTTEEDQEERGWYEWEMIDLKDKSKSAAVEDSSTHLYITLLIRVYIPAECIICK